MCREHASDWFRAYGDGNLGWYLVSVVIIAALGDLGLFFTRLPLCFCFACGRCAMPQCWAWPITVRRIVSRTCRRNLQRPRLVSLIR